MIEISGPQPFLAPGPNFMDDSFSTEQGDGVVHVVMWKTGSDR